MHFPAFQTARPSALCWTRPTSTRPTLTRYMANTTLLSLGHCSRCSPRRVVARRSSSAARRRACTSRAAERCSAAPPGYCYPPRAEEGRDGLLDAPGRGRGHGHAPRIPRGSHAPILSSGSVHRSTHGKPALSRIAHGHSGRQGKTLLRQLLWCGGLSLGLSPQHREKLGSPS